MRNFEGIPKIEMEKNKEETFKEYVRSLDLTPEDFNKKILDVGSGASEFAAWAKERGVSNNIYSMDIHPGILDENNKTTPGVLESERSVVANAEQIPFKDESFDLLISNASVPHMYYEYQSDEDPKIMEEKIRNTLSEMVRLTKPGGEIRLNPILDGNIYPVFKKFRKSFDKILGDIANENNLEIEWINKRETNFTDGVDNSWLVKIKKTKGFLSNNNKK